MDIILKQLTLAIVLLPLVGAIGAGLFGKKIGRSGAHWLTIVLVGMSFALAIYVFKLVIMDGMSFTGPVYTWAISGKFNFHVGFLIDPLSALMMITVTFVSFLVHIYTIGYMQDDPGYQRFFAYISLFTFAMLMLVSGDNFLQLFFGWEGVGVVSYFLIGFWFKRDSANVGSMKAFLVNRVGDFGFILGISAILTYFGSIEYAQVFSQADAMANAGTTMSIFPGSDWSVITVICICLFIGAAGKSAQIPLHVWLPESMEGPTPISALIHAATMVTAGVYMLARMSPLVELSEVTLSLVLIVGASGALFLGLVGIVQHDIKRVVAYSTLSQLGYMMAGIGSSAFAAGIFHLFTHASFKALLFLGAGSVIIAMHHEQDMRKMGGLRKYMPITYITFLIGALSLAAVPPFAGFYSKDAIIEAVAASHIFGSSYAYICVLLGAFVTSVYIFRAFFLTFHGKERMDEKLRKSLCETPAVVWVPLALLAIPSIVLGFIFVGPMLFDNPSLFGSAIYVAPQYDVLGHLAEHYHGAVAMALHAVSTLPFWFALAGIFAAWFFCLAKPDLRAVLTTRLSIVYRVLVAKYGFDTFNEKVLVRGTKVIANFLHDISDMKFIDGLMVNGSGKVVQWVSGVSRRLQSGYLYHYTFAMILGLVVFLLWLILG